MSKKQQTKEPKEKFRHITKYDQGKKKSLTPKPKDWAFRTQAEGRPKSVNSRRCKDIPMERKIWIAYTVAIFLNNVHAGTSICQWDISSENPARKLTAQDVLDLIHLGNEDYEIKINYEKKILIFVDLSDVLTGGHDDTKLPKPLCPKCGNFKTKCICQTK